MSDCLLCDRGLDDAVEIATTSRHGHPSRRVICAACSLVQVSPQPTRAELLAYYTSHDYRTEHGPVPVTITRPSGAETIEPGSDRYDWALDTMAAWRASWGCERGGLIEGQRLLEIGSGDGRTLAAYAARGLDVTGVEPDEQEAASSVARLPETARVHAGSFEATLGALDGGPYDAIAMYHVLEHLHDPVGTLRELRRLLTPRGALIVEVPNILRPGLPLEHHYQHVHLVDFSEYTLAAALVRARFEPLWIGTEGALRSVSRPETQPGAFTVPHGGQYVHGFLDAVGAMTQGVTG